MAAGNAIGEAAVNPHESGMDWQQVESRRGILIWVRKLSGDSWVAAVTPRPVPPVSMPGIASPSGDMVLPETYASQRAAVEAAKRYVDREQESSQGETQAPPAKGRVRRRQFDRIPVALPVIGQAPQFREMDLPGMVRSVAPGGLMVEFPVVVVPGSLLRLAIQTGLGPVEVEGRVVWTAVTRGTIRHGLAFPVPKGPDFASELQIVEWRSKGRGYP
jgi:hypothetical protein